MLNQIRPKGKKEHAYKIINIYHIPCLYKVCKNTISISYESLSRDVYKF